ncbi:HNH endonuclease [Xanthomonas citri pv. fuscans]|uniref:HNH endonuclease signature motif containing protein n=1 Tax=Xanthomonas citri TaxID=346 RepID=UPI002227B5BD|nr:HNH endonuclease signature motif containing protein [Xanthomonas citri]UZB05518.1 HNH endonuclease [Xanthomonas citri pv. fuscans]
MMTVTLNHERANEVLSYDAETGLFLWRVGRGGTAKGAVAGSKSVAGYVQIKFDRKFYYAHRVAWLLIHGRWPSHHIDHINGVRDDNRLANLRECSAGQNQQNRGRSSNNASGYTGVSFHSLVDKWQAHIQINGLRSHLGYFQNSEDARAAYLAAKAQFHKFNPVIRSAA